MDFRALEPLNDLCYIVECAAQDHTGELKSELSALCDRIESAEPPYHLAHYAASLPELKDALEFYRSRKLYEGAIRLSAVSRLWWNELRDSLDAQGVASKPAPQSAPATPTPSPAPAPAPKPAAAPKPAPAAAPTPAPVPKVEPQKGGLFGLFQKREDPDRKAFREEFEGTVRQLKTAPVESQIAIGDAINYGYSLFVQRFGSPEQFQKAPLPERNAYIASLTAVEHQLRDEKKDLPGSLGFGLFKMWVGTVSENDTELMKQLSKELAFFSKKVEGLR